MATELHQTSPSRFEEIEVGHVYEACESFGPREMDQFAALSGDHSAIHSDKSTAQRLGFPDRVQYGFLLAALLSRIVGENFHHAVCAAVQLDFVKPAIAGDRVDVRAEVTRVQPAMRSVVLKITMLIGDEVITRGKLTTIFLREV